MPVFIGLDQLWRSFKLFIPCLVMSQIKFCHSQIHMFVTIELNTSYVR